MRIVEVIGFILLLLGLGLLGIFFRRWILVRRGGTIQVSMRLTTLISGRGWSMGLGRFVGDELRWYRILSLSWRPRRVIVRRGLSVIQRRQPDEEERKVLPEGWAVLQCVNRRNPVEISMARQTLAGFLSWMEASPPGAIPDPPFWSKAG
jgi:hypothetical protein